MRRLLTIFACVCAVAPRPAGAQGLKSYVRDLFFQGIVDSQESPTEVLQNAQASADELAKFTTLSLLTAPVVASSAGFVYVRDKTSGEMSLKTESFGPLYAERPFTNGKRVFNIGVNHQYSKTAFRGGFGTADGRDIGLPLFDNTATYRDGFVQFITKRAFLEARSQTLNMFTTYGLTDRFDIGLVVPVTSLTLEGHTEEDYDVSREWAANEATVRADRMHPSGIITTAARSTHRATGIGDIGLRFKYSLVEGTGDGVAVAGDLRLPSGDDQNMLGTGKTSLKLLLVASKGGVGPASLHANAGYTAGGLSRELNYIMGADAAILPQKRLTVSASFLGRTLSDGAALERIATVRRTVDRAPTGVRDIVVDRFFWNEGTLSLLQIAVGAKVNVGRNWLINASVLVPANETGMQPGITPAVGFERTWTRQ
jgi:hypothetical protein